MTISDAPMSATTAIHERGVADDRQHQERGLQGERERDVRADVADGGAAEAERVGDLQQLVGHQRDVGRLERGVAAGDAHRDADVGRRERRRVVDAVADHRQRAVARCAAPRPRATLSSGSSPARTSSMPSCLGERARRGFVIARQQRHVSHALLAQQLDGVARRLADADRRRR